MVEHLTCRAGEYVGSLEVPKLHLLLYLRRHALAYSHNSINRAGHLDNPSVLKSPLKCV